MFVTIRNWFRSFFNILYWICFIGCAIAGFGIADKMGAHPFIGIVLGILVGLLLNVIFGGFVATIISIDTNLEAIKDKLNGGSSS